MGKNKQSRKRIRGQFRVVEEHQQKITRELEKESPDMRLIRKWNKDIDRAQKLMRELEEKLAR
ncbi:MAG TPA: hypothetical protein VFL79_17635 [Terriglobia bacterium]|nr:hypothetical protein [Terriglobia bacterium]